VETALSLPTREKEKPEAPTSEAVNRGQERRSWRLLDALLRFRAFEAIRYHEFRLIWLGQVFATMATWMDQVARGWLIVELTNLAFQLGLVRGIQAIPLLLLSPVAGSTADRYSRKMQLIVTQVGGRAAVRHTGPADFFRPNPAMHVYATAFGMAFVQTFQQPSRLSLVADAMPSSHLTNAIGAKVEQRVEGMHVKALTQFSGKPAHQPVYSGNIDGYVSVLVRFRAEEWGHQREIEVLPLEIELGVILPAVPYGSYGHDHFTQLFDRLFPFYPVPQNDPCVSAGMNVPTSL
jgi:hypothetical protein